MKTILITMTFFSLLVSTVTYSAHFDNCKIVEIVAAGINNGHVALDCAIDPRPACAVAGNFFGFDKSTVEGEQYMSIVLTAFSLGARVSGYVSTTQCSPYQGNVALLQHIRMKK